MKKVGVIGIPGRWSSEELANSVEKKTGYRLLIDLEKIYVDFGKKTAFYEDTDLSSLDAVIIKKVGESYSPNLLERLEILRYLQNKVPFFSKPSSIISLFNRLSCTVSLQNRSIPMPETFVTADINAACTAVSNFKKAVFKPMYTSKARGMEIISDEEDVRQKVSAFHEKNEVMYIQKLIEPFEKDLGVIFLGGEYIGTYARVKNNDSWNTTTNSGGKYASYEPSQAIIDIAYKAQKIFDLDFTCVDVVETDDGPKIFEVSAFGGFRGILHAQNIVAADLYVDYVLKSIS